MRATNLLTRRAGRLATAAAALLLEGSAAGEPSGASQAKPLKCSSLAASAGRYEPAIEAAVREVAPVWPLPTSLIKAVVLIESDFRPAAVSAAGAVGLMQVLPSNAQRLGFEPGALWFPAENLRAGTRLLAVLFKHYRGDVISALVAYNARPRRRLAPLPDNGETPRYVRAVLRAWARFERCGARR